MNMKSLPLILIVLLLAIGGGVLAFNLWNNGRQMEKEGMGGRAVDQSHRSYELELTSNTEGTKPQELKKITYKIKNDKGQVLKNFETVHEKIMHFIVVRKDLQNFQHLHPEFNQVTGGFTVSVTFPSDGPYRVFPDFTSGDDNPQKLPATVFADLNVGDIKNYKAQAVIADKQPNKTVDGYEITYSLPAILEQKKEVQYSLMINKNGQPVTNLNNYLGALGHSVILKADTLDFIHTHAGDKPGMNQGTDMGHTSETTMMQNEANRGPQINFTTTFSSSGVYKIFTQFQHVGKVITTDFVAEVK